ncbi:unnamed protein product [Ectocarpus sp. 12 AP-2014]
MLGPPPAPYLTNMHISTFLLSPLPTNLLTARRRLYGTTLLRQAQENKPLKQMQAGRTHVRSFPRYYAANNANAHQKKKDSTSILVLPIAHRVDAHATHARACFA